MKTRPVFDRLAEPSTWAGLAAIALAFGVNAEAMDTITAALAGIFGVIAMFARERGSE